MRKTKIISTLGPASEDPQMLKSLIKKGVSVVRLNFSHGTQEWHGAQIEKVRKIEEELGTPVAVLLDTKGPEIRTGVFEGVVSLPTDELMILSPKGRFAPEERCIPVSFAGLAADVQKGDIIKLDDGAMTAIVEEVKNGEIVCKMKIGGSIKAKKHVNLPGVLVNIPTIGEQDKEDIEFGVKMGVDFIALSFVRRAADVEQAREIVKKAGGHAQIVSKIEHPEAVKHLEAIIAASDGIMIARGDLGVEMEYYDVPLIEEDILRATRKQGKPVIVATQVIESMITKETPTRAEITDIYFAGRLGADMVMTSGETAGGQFPEACVEVLNKTLTHLPMAWEGVRHLCQVSGVKAGLARSGVMLAESQNVGAIIAFTKTGEMASLTAAMRPKQKLFVVCDSVHVMRQMQMVWGISGGAVIDFPNDEPEEMMEMGIQKLKKDGHLSEGEMVVVVSAMRAVEKKQGTRAIHMRQVM